MSISSNRNENVEIYVVLQEWTKLGMSMLETVWKWGSGREGGREWFVLVWTCDDKRGNVCSDKVMDMMLKDGKEEAGQGKDG